MKSVKTTEEMTRGNGMSELQRVQWLLSMPACSNINNAMQEFENLQYCSSDQHKESSKSRQERDNKDVKTILSFMTDSNPFIENADLRNIEKRCDRIKGSLCSPSVRGWFTHYRGIIGRTRYIPNVYEEVHTSKPS